MNNFDAQTVTASEHGLVRVFYVNRPLDMRRGETLSLAQICEALGVARLDETNVQQIWNFEVEDLSFIDFLRRGYDVNEADVQSQKPVLDALDEDKALLVVIRSSAFQDRPATINLYGGLMNHVATLREPDTSVTFQPLPDEGAKGPAVEPAKRRPPSDAAMSGRVATVALLVMALLVWLMIWIAG